MFTYCIQYSRVLYFNYDDEICRKERISLTS